MAFFNSSSKGNMFRLVSTLTAGETEVTFIDPRINDETFIFQPATETGITPTSFTMDAAHHSITYVYEAQATNVGVCIVCVNE